MIEITQEISDIVDDTIAFIENHKDQAVNQLFNNRKKNIRDKWKARETVNFWGLLTQQERIKLIEMAREHYS